MLKKRIPEAYTILPNSVLSEDKNKNTSMRYYTN